MTAWFLSLLLSMLAAALWHGFSLQVASVLAGEEAPGFFKAMAVSFKGSVFGWGAALLWRFTLGLFVSLFVSSWLAWGLGIAIAYLVTAGIYRRSLRLTSAGAYGVAGVHMLISYGATLLLGYFGYALLF